MQSIQLIKICFKSVTCEGFIGKEKIDWVMWGIKTLSGYGWDSAL